MKKLSLFFATLLCAFAVNAATTYGKVSFDANGGTLAAVPADNDALWEEFEADYAKDQGKTLTTRALTCEATKNAVAAYMSVGGAVTSKNIPFLTGETSPWKWLGDYIIQVTANATNPITLSTGEAVWRYNVQGFFQQTDGTDNTSCAWHSYIKNDYSVAGTPAAWQPYYAFAHTPTHETKTFKGWYSDADCTQKVDVLTDEITTLYAGWNEFATDFYLVGHINGKDDEGKDYHFENDELTVTVNANNDWYVFVKDNLGQTYMTEGWLGETVTSAKLIKNPTSGNKLFVPKHGEYKLTLKHEDDGSLTLSYQALPERFFLTGYIDNKDCWDRTYAFDETHKLTIKKFITPYVALMNNYGDTYMVRTFVDGIKQTEGSAALEIAQEGVSEKIGLPTGTVELTITRSGEALTLAFVAKNAPAVKFDLQGGEVAEPALDNGALWMALRTAYDVTYNFVGSSAHQQEISNAAGALWSGDSKLFNFFDKEANASWLWLRNYIQAVGTAQGITLDKDGSLRWALQAFLICAKGTNDADGTDFTEAGYPYAWQPAFIFAQTPVKGETEFLGWYDNADGTGAKLIALPESGTVYAVWKNGGTTALDNATLDKADVRKVMENGQLIIIRNGVRYNAMGTVIR